MYIKVFLFFQANPLPFAPSGKILPRKLSNLPNAYSSTLVLSLDLASISHASTLYSTLVHPLDVAS